MSCFNTKVMASMTEAYKNQSLNGKHVGAYVPNSEYQIPTGFDTPKGRTYSSSSGKIKVQLNNSSATANIPNDRLIMYPETKDATKMATNTSNLQYVIDQVSQAGGGVVTVSAGNYYMTAGGFSGTGENEFETNHYVIKAKNNVTVVGTRGADGDLLTTFLPYGQGPNGVTMFQYFQENLRNAVYLVNADYRDFRIDGINATHNFKEFHAQGKGFAFVIVRDCDWYNVEVLNTNGTGFGMDELVNSTVINCSANGCGNYSYNNNGTILTPGSGASDVGASGFGIGYGYSTDESIVIKNCLSTNNRRFGIFFECQYRFSNKDVFQYKYVDKLEASDNICAGNRYNMGGECCFASIYKNNISRKYSDEFGYPNPMNIVNNNIHYYFGKHDKVESRDNMVTFPNGVTMKYALYDEDEIYSDLDCEKWQCEPVNFVIKSKYMDAKSPTEFGINDEITRGELVETLYRLYGTPIVKYTNLYTDVTPTHKFANSIVWANSVEIAKGYQNGTGKFGPDDIISRRDTCIMFYRFAKLNDSTITSSGNLSEYLDGNEITVKEHKEAVKWCLDAGIISLKKDIETGEYKILPSQSITRAEIAAMTYKFVNYMKDIDYTQKGYLKGDLDRNGVVDANDASMSLEMYKAQNATQNDVLIGDMDNNDLIDANDASLILEYFKTHQ